MSPDAFKSRPARPAAPARRSASSTTRGAVFPFRFELFAMIDDYLEAARRPRRSTCPRAITRCWRGRRRCGPRSPRIRCRIVACHCDPLCENFLDTGERMWIVDWEYSGMNDPMWDLGDLSVEAGFDAGAGRGEMLAGYFGGAPRRRRARPHGHLQGDVRPAVDALGPDPARQQQSRPTISGPMPRDRFARCRRLMESDGFGAHLEAARRG